MTSRSPTGCASAPSEARAYSLRLTSSSVSSIRETSPVWASMGPRRRRRANMRTRAKDKLPTVTPCTASRCPGRRHRGRPCPRPGGPRRSARSPSDLQRVVELERSQRVPVVVDDSAPTQTGTPRRTGARTGAHRGGAQHGRAVAPQALRGGRNHGQARDPAPSATGMRQRSRTRRQPPDQAVRSGSASRRYRQAVRRVPLRFHLAGCFLHLVMLTRQPGDGLRSPGMAPPEPNVCTHRQVRPWSRSSVVRAGYRRHFPGCSDSLRLHVGDKPTGCRLMGIARRTLLVEPCDQALSH
ncbi:hypothetical protein SHL15_8971 [Streptomyces hygroscopicus subsp. limoneus]|nr:hypothetical protein SHL15_8971 [Streptomyces hygroscopicus subsp. limoneus]